MLGLLPPYKFKYTSRHYIISLIRIMKKNRINSTRILENYLLDLLIFFSNAYTLPCPFTAQNKPRSWFMGPVPHTSYDGWVNLMAHSYLTHQHLLRKLNFYEKNIPRAKMIEVSGNDLEYPSINPIAILHFSLI